MRMYSSAAEDDKKAKEVSEKSSDAPAETEENKEKPAESSEESKEDAVKKESSENDSEKKESSETDSEKKDSSEKDSEKKDSKEKDSKEEREKTPDEKQEEETKIAEEAAKSNGDGPKNSWILIGMVGVGLLLMFNIFTGGAAPGPSEMTFEELKQQLLDRKVESIEYDTLYNVATVRWASTGESRHSKLKALNPEDFGKKLLKIEKELPGKLEDYTKIVYTRSFDWSFIFRVLDSVLFLGILIYMQRSAMQNTMGKGGFMSMINGPSRIQKYNKKVNVRFSDVAGMEEAKAEITEFVDFLKTPDHYKKLGARLPRGAILMGSPGTGKTLLAKAVAGESEVPFYSISGSEFIEMYVGVGASRVRELFSKARKHKRAIIFIDEIDAIGRKRGSGRLMGGHDERENTLNQLLTEMDGFSQNTNIVVMASTNIKLDELDPALLRAGRFDRQITVDKPDKRERVEIFNVHLKGIVLADEVKENVDLLADRTPGFTGADIANVCNEGAIFAARANKDKVDLEDMEKAIDRVVGGIERKNSPITKREKTIIAYHEAGHAITAWFCEHCDPLLKLSIIPRGKALGYAQYLPKETHIRTFEHLKDMMTQAMGGRVAEKMKFGHLSTGAQDDLQKITMIAYRAISTFGMNEDIGPVSFPIPGEGDAALRKPYSDKVAEIMDEEVRKLIQLAWSRCEDILSKHTTLLEMVAQRLIEKEVLSKVEFEGLIKEYEGEQGLKEGGEAKPDLGQ